MGYNSEHQKENAQYLLKNKDLNCVALCKHSPVTFALSAPKLYKHYAGLVTNIKSHHCELCFSHTDSVVLWQPPLILKTKWLQKDMIETKKNPASLCAVVSLRHYDHKCGGHLVLYEPKFILGFPPNWVIFCTHWNIEISGLCLSLTILQEKFSDKLHMGIRVKRNLIQNSFKR